MAGLSASAMRALAKELHDLQANPCDGIRLLVNETDLGDIQAEIDGPHGTPYAGGVFTMKLSLPADFPASPPRGTFLTKIWHPNVSKAGEICVNVLKRDWAPDLGLRHVLMVVRCLLIQPFPDSALNEDAGRALLEDYEAYRATAALMTELHAARRGRGGGGGAAAAAAASGSGAGEQGSAAAAGSAAEDEEGADAAAAAAGKRHAEPLSATAAGANHAGAGSGNASGAGGPSGGAAGAGGAGGGGPASPAIKKAKPTAQALNKNKKSLKRL